MAEVNNIDKELRLARREESGKCEHIEIALRSTIVARVRK